MNPFAYAFASDNTAPATPEALAALHDANQDPQAASYGADRFTLAASAALKDWFECPHAEVFFVFGGTAANALALAALRQPYESVFCSGQAHIEKDESAAPEFFAQGLKLHLIGDARGDKLDLAQAAELLRGNRGMHSPQPRVISLTMSTEFGTLYSQTELQAIAEFAREHKLRVHMDGARFTNALAATGSTPAELSWKSGVDVLSLGGTKNGVSMSEALVFFDPELAQGFLNRRKQGGQLASKMRLLSAPWLGAMPRLIERAAHANACAARLAQGFQALGLRLAFPVEVNGVFVHLDNELVRKLEAHDWHFYWFYGADIYRFMCAWNTSELAIAALLEDLRACQAIGEKT